MFFGCLPCCGGLSGYEAFGLSFVVTEQVSPFSIGARTDYMLVPGTYVISAEAKSQTWTTIYNKNNSDFTRQVYLISAESPEHFDIVRGPSGQPSGRLSFFEVASPSVTIGGIPRGHVGLSFPSGFYERPRIFFSLQHLLPAIPGLPVFAIIGVDWSNPGSIGSLNSPYYPDTITFTDGSGASFTTSFNLRPPLLHPPPVSRSFRCYYVPPNASYADNIDFNADGQVDQIEIPQDAIVLSSLVMPISCTITWFPRVSYVDGVPIAYSQTLSLNSVSVVSEFLTPVLPSGSDTGFPLTSQLLI